MAQSRKSGEVHYLLSLKISREIPMMRVRQRFVRRFPQQKISLVRTYMHREILLHQIFTFAGPETRRMQTSKTLQMIIITHSLERLFSAGNSALNQTISISGQILTSHYSLLILRVESRTKTRSSQLNFSSKHASLMWITQNLSQTKTVIQKLRNINMVRIWFLKRKKPGER